jgi:hypothetical protein
LATATWKAVIRSSPGRRQWSPGARKLAQIGLVPVAKPLAGGGVRVSPGDIGRAVSAEEFPGELPASALRVVSTTSALNSTAAPSGRAEAWTDASALLAIHPEKWCHHFHFAPQLGNEPPGMPSMACDYPHLFDRDLPGKLSKFTQYTE